MCDQEHSYPGWFTVHVACSQIHIDLPTLSDEDKDVWTVTVALLISPFLQNLTFNITDIEDFGQNYIFC